MNFHVDQEMAFFFMVVGVAWSVLITVLWLWIAHRAMRAHERIATVFETWLSGR